MSIEQKTIFRRLGLGQLKTGDQPDRRGPRNLTLKLSPSSHKLHQQYQQLQLQKEPQRVQQHPQQLRQQRQLLPQQQGNR